MRQFQQFLLHAMMAIIITPSRNYKSSRNLRKGFLACTILCLCTIAPPSYAADQDSDGIDDGLDNCLLVPNPAQRDTNADGYGNFCDPDLNNDRIVNFLDLGIMRSVLFTADPDADLNGDGAVNFVDLGIMRSMLFQPPGPRGLLHLQAIPGNSQVTLHWETVVGATSYNIYWNTTGSVTTLDNKITGVTSPYDHTGLINGTTYYYIVTAVYVAGESAPSGEVLAIPNIYTVYFVSSTAIDDSGDGLSPATAKQTIPAAIAAATAPALVWVNAGTYNVNSDTTGTPTHVVLSEGISLYGGYTADFSDRDPAINITTITDNSTLMTGSPTLPNSALEAGAGVSSATIVDGFVLNGSNQLGADFTAAIWVHDGGVPTVQNNTFNGGSGSIGSIGMLSDTTSPTVQNNILNGGSGASSIGMYNSTSSPTVRYNTLNGGSGGTSSFGMYNDTSSPTVQNNTLNGGNGGTASNGMYNYISSPTVQNNTLNGGSAGHSSYGMFNYTSSPTVQNNTLNGGSGISSSTGMYNFMSSSPMVQNNILNGGSGSNGSSGMINNNDSSPLVQNNILNAGASEASTGMSNFGSSPKVQNNTINGGSGLSAYGMFTGISSSPTIDNNIIFANGTVAEYCIFESATGSDPASVRNNDLFCTSAYRDFDAGCTGNGDGDGDDTTCTLAEMEALTDFIPLGASGNVSADPQFVDIDGPDNDINTMNDNDWHFNVSSPLSVTAGGLNGEDDGGWGFTTDKDGITRPGTGSDWSMGAYEP